MSEQEGEASTQLPSEALELKPGITYQIVKEGDGEAFSLKDASSQENAYLLTMVHRELTHANQTEPREHEIIEHVEERGSVYEELYDLMKEGEVRRYSLSRFIVTIECSRRLNPDDVLRDPCVLEIELHKIEVKSHRVASAHDSPGLKDRRIFARPDLHHRTKAMRQPAIVNRQRSNPIPIGPNDGRRKLVPPGLAKEA